MGRTKTGLIYIILLVINLSCSNSNTLYEKSFSIPDDGWSLDHKLESSWTTEESVSGKVVLIHVLHSPEFKYQNLYLTGEIRKDIQSLWADTFSIQLARRNSGRWLGQKLDDKWRVTDTIPFSIETVQGETFHFEFSQFSRDGNLSGIEKVEVEVIQ